MTTADATRRWGIAWVALVVALALHVADEALNGFLPLYNAVVTDLRATYSWFPMPTFTFRAWLGGLITGVVVLAALSPLAFGGNRFFRPFSYFFGVFMMLNGLGHLGMSIYSATVAPGTISSPALLLAAMTLVTATARAA